MSINVRLSGGLLAAVIANSGTGCALNDKVNKIPGLEYVEVLQSLE